MKKVCFKCNQEKDLSEFYKHPLMSDGHLGKCKECAKKDVRENYKLKRQERSEYEKKRFKNPKRKADMLRYGREARKKNPEKQRARNAVSYALRMGKLKRMPCLVCGNPKSEAHHKDYSKPLEVEWLCFLCHRTRHGQTVTCRDHSIVKKL